MQLSDLEVHVQDLVETAIINTPFKDPRCAMSTRMIFPLTWENELRRGWGQFFADHVRSGAVCPPATYDLYYEHLYETDREKLEKLANLAFGKAMQLVCYMEAANNQVTKEGPTQIEMPPPKKPDQSTEGLFNGIVSFFGERVGIVTIGAVTIVTMLIASMATGLFSIDHVIKIFEIIWSKP